MTVWIFNNFLNYRINKTTIGDSFNKSIDRVMGVSTMVSNSGCKQQQSGSWTSWSGSAGNQQVTKVGAKYAFLKEKICLSRKLWSVDQLASILLRIFKWGVYVFSWKTTSFEGQIVVCLPSSRLLSGISEMWSSIKIPQVLFISIVFV